jgi:hypothetical protein
MCRGLADTLLRKVVIASLSLNRCAFILKVRILPLTFEIIGDPGRIRTCDQQLRRLLLCPAELRGLGRGVNANRIMSRRLERVHHPSGTGVRPETGRFAATDAAKPHAASARVERRHPPINASIDRRG